MSHNGTEVLAKAKADKKAGTLDISTLTARQLRRMEGGRKQRKAERPAKKAIKRVHRKAGKQRK
jgi:hypothetical protein